MTSVEIAFLITIIGGVTGAATFFIGRQTAAKKDGLEWGSFQTELKKDIEYIKRDIGELKLSMDEDNRDLKLSLRRVHSRLDEHLRRDHKQLVAESANEAI